MPLPVGRFGKPGEDGMNFLAGRAGFCDTRHPSARLAVTDEADAGPKLRYRRLGGRFLKSACPSMNPPSSGLRTALDRLGRYFVPILAGATLRERLIGCVGALLGVMLTGLICDAILGSGAHLPLIVAPVGASAVLLFAVPASPLAQPWPIIGGNTISALVGVTAVHLIADPFLASGLGVSLAILAMSFTRSLHPPGGAVALTAVIGGPAVVSAGYAFPFVPVALNSLLLVALGVAFHRLSRRSYPHVPAPAVSNTHQTSDLPAVMRVGFRREDIDAALLALNETFDIDRDDLDRIFRRIELQSLVRLHGELTCGEIMSRDVISIPADASPERARALLLERNIRTLPVIGDDGRLAGIVGLRELEGATGRLGDAVSPAAVAAPDEHALELLPVLTDGRSHAVVIVDAERHVLGMITQTDLLAAAARLLRHEGGGKPSAGSKRF